jgi:hypothetical protein
VQTTRTTTMLASDSWPRRVARGAGLGRAALAGRQRMIRLRMAALTYHPSRKYLPLARTLAPVPTSEGGIEVHMLLHHARIYEGMWAVYSFSYFTGHACRFVIHDDGSLTSEYTHLLETVFPHCKLISRAAADAVVVPYLRQHNLLRCLAWRAERPVARKLIDVGLLATDPEYVIADSDVLFFARPSELVDNPSGSGQGPIVPRYSLDIETCYCLPPDELTTILGRKCISACNVGVLRTSAPDLTRIDSYLAHPAFWEHWWGEQTLWAMDLTLRGAVALPPSYVTAPETIPIDAVSLHCCGIPDSRILYYRQALPRIASIIRGEIAPSLVVPEREGEPAS